MHADREGLVDEDLRLTYGQLFDRCDRWSAALQQMGVRHGDRVAYIAPNTHGQLESFIAVPQGVTFVEELPKTATGKIQKFVLREGAPNLTRQ